MSFELYIPPIPKKRKRYKIDWTPEMITRLKNEFPTRYNKELAAELNVSWRSLVRKARQLGIEKEKGFLDKRRPEIQAMAQEAHPPHPYKGIKGWCVPNSEQNRFQKGQRSIMKTNPMIVQKVRAKRNATIARERRRMQLGLSPLTKLKIRK